jgi:hypothetical protein
MIDFVYYAYGLYGVSYDIIDDLKFIYSVANKINREQITNLQIVNELYRTWLEHANDFDKSLLITNIFGGTCGILNRDIDEYHLASVLLSGLRMSHINEQPILNSNMVINRKHYESIKEETYA